ncbi:TPA: HlyD family secretion protein [Raoultella ornithinolytica]|uniref:HlyD family secretion protein n=1 Tax=Raoultella ornithinolytica TaxID=54291 RepID=UPI0022A88BB4|nr:HlyD family secretion protein [Raoultella ornithinolytica]MCZ0882696.1 HlyD family secretion protein [Raoultella ornithinolytica]MDV1102110.1 HlyD family secretion protein [Raoultella ornithinolytica]HDH7838751.1 HlyD family secretion protein [Raoultella ornithinolytica]HDT6555361.1 HlyD family secretion protein [Raoultella ornithinolytica]
MTSTGNAPVEAVQKTKPLFKLVPWIILLAGLSAVLLVIVNWNRYEAGERVQSTDNSSVNKNSTVLNAKVSGYIKSVDFNDFQHVKKGQLLVQLVDDDYRAALQSAEASLLKAKSSLKNLDNELAQQAAVVSQSQATADSGKARTKQAQSDDRRYRSLSGSGAVTAQATDSASYAYAQAKASWDSALADIEVQKKKRDVLAGQREQREAEVLAAQSSVETAALNLSYTRITAPEDGVVGVRDIQTGQLLSSGATVTNFVSASAPYVISNYKETQLDRIRPGQHVDIEVDSLPGQVFTGTVGTISPATGSTFTVIPADNATGNFTKVTQRIPVRINFDPDQRTLDRLRAGMSTTTHIDTAGAE